MKSSLVSKLSGKDSSPAKKPTARTGNAMPYAHYLGLDFPKAKAAAKTPSMTASAPRKPAAKPAASAKPTPAATKATAKAAKPESRKKPAMPFSSLMNGFKPSARSERAADTLNVPEMVNGVATGRFIEVQRSEAEAPKLDASAIARRIVAAGKRVFGK